MYNKIVFLLTLMVVLGSCSSDNEVTAPDFGYDFFPLSVGDFREYEVLEVNFNTSGPDTSRYFLKEAIIDSVLNGEVHNYILERSVRENADSPWKVDSLWTARITPREAIQVENNIPILKIQFPVEDGMEWDSNAFNVLDAKEYTSELIKVDSLDSQVLKVIIADIEANFVLKDERFDYYARGIGLIVRDLVSINFCQSNCASEGQPESGRVLNQKLISYGKN